MYDGYYDINLEINKTLVNLPDVKTSDRKSRGMNITRTLNSVVQNTANQAIYLNAITPDSRHIFAMADVIDTNVGHYILTFPDSMLRVAGAVQIELMIVDPVGTISTNTGTINVVQAVTDYADIESAPDYPALIQALNIIQDMQAQLTAMGIRLDNAELFQTGTIVMSPTVLDINHWVPLDGRPTTGLPTLIPIYGANLPDMNGRTAFQLDATQTEFNTLNKIGGEKVHILSVPEMPSHLHPLGIYTSITENAGHYGFSDTAGRAFQDRVMVTGSKANTASYMDTTGGGQAHNNLPPYGVLGKYYVHK